MPTQTTEISRDDARKILLMKKSELTAHKISREDIAIEKNAEALDDIQQSADRALVLNALTRDWETNSLIAEALERIADGTYGICVECDEEISAKRIAALPWAKRCIKCQEMADRAAAETRWDLAA